MPIPQYRLDDRSFDDLVKELVARIPAHTPEWTNPQEGDPGRTLIDLFAWLGDTLLYRVNLLPERQRLEFLRLLNIPMHPATPARCMIALESNGSAVSKTVQVPLYTTVKGPLNFETTDEVTVFPLSGQVYAKRKPTEEEQQAFAPIQDQLEDVYNISREDAECRCSNPYVTTRLYEELPHDPAGFDFVRNTIDGCLWLALLVPKGEQNNRDLIRQLLSPDQNGAQILNIGIQPRITVPEFAELTHLALVMDEIWQWEMPTKAEGSQYDAFNIPYLPLRVKTDTTEGFTRQGIVKLVMPSHEQIELPTNNVDEDIYAGTGNKPPRIDDEEIAGRLLTWIRLRPKRTTESLALTWLGVNAVPVDQCKTVQNIVLTSSNGQADQVVQLPGAYVERSSFELQVEEPGKGYQSWQDYPLHAADFDDRVFELDEESGIVKFGDGLRGAVPEAGSRIRVQKLRFGGGRQGNIPAGNLNSITIPNLKVTQPIDASQGVDAETLEQAETRIPAVLKHGERAVTEEDYRQLALNVPGVEVGRVEILAKFKPQQRLANVTGVISVMVLPKVPLHQPPNPRPDRSMLNQVHAYLEQRRPIGVELYVIGSEYIPLGLSTSITIRDGFPRQQVLQNVENALRDYLWSLPPGGPKKKGWPLGERIYNKELEVVVARVKGVNMVYGVNIFLKDLQNQWQLHGSNDFLKLEEWQLPELLAVSIVEDEELPPDSLKEEDFSVSMPGDSEADGVVDQMTVIPIPVVPESCK